MKASRRTRRRLRVRREVGEGLIQRRFDRTPTSPYYRQSLRTTFADLKRIVKDGKPTAAILDVGEYRKMPERLLDAEGLRILKEMRKKPLRFKKLDNFLKEYSPRA